MEGCVVEAPRVAPCGMGRVEGPRHAAPGPRDEGRPEGAVHAGAGPVPGARCPDGGVCVTGGDGRQADEPAREPARGAFEPGRESFGVAHLTPKELGRRGEQACARHLSQMGCTILERNWRCDVGEADLVIEDEGGECALVEVKTRLALDGREVVPELAVNEAKLGRYRTLCLLYMALHPEVGAVRFDVAAVSVASDEVAHLHYLAGVWVGEL